MSKKLNALADALQRARNALGTADMELTILLSGKDTAEFLNQIKDVPQLQKYQEMTLVMINAIANMETVIWTDM